MYSVVNVLFALLLSMISNTASSEVTPAPRWIHGSWVNVRSKPAMDADIVNIFTTNTPVALLSEHGEWCEVNRTEPTLVHGYMACNLLGAKPLTLSAAQMPTRAFWIAPSMYRLEQVGDFLYETMTSKSQKAKEHPQINVQTNEIARPLGEIQPRQSIAEFDAMKSMLRAGMVAAKERQSVLTPWDEITSLGTDPDSRYFFQAIKSLEKQSGLSMQKSSYFKKLDEIAPADTGVEGLSAQFAIPEKLEIDSGPYWSNRPDGLHEVKGTWDIGRYKLKLMQSIYLIYIGKAGEVASISQQPVQCFGVTAEKDECNNQFQSGPNIAFEPVTRFYSSRSISAQHASYKTLSKSLSSSEPTQDQTPNWRINRYDIDLDADDTTDMVIWRLVPENMDTGTLNAGEYSVTIVNVAGVPYLLNHCPCP